MAGAELADAVALAAEGEFVPDSVKAGAGGDTCSEDIVELGVAGGDIVHTVGVLDVGGDERALVLEVVVGGLRAEVVAFGGRVEGVDELTVQVRCVDAVGGVAREGEVGVVPGGPQHGIVHVGVLNSRVGGDEVDLFQVGADLQDAGAREGEVGFAAALAVIDGEAAVRGLEHLLRFGGQMVRLIENAEAELPLSADAV